MIKVNLIGASRKKAARPGVKRSVSTSLMSLFLLLVVLGSAGYGYWWYLDLRGKVDDLNSKLRQAQAQKAALEAVIKQDQIYESRKKMIENRVKIIEGLQRNQISPVVALDFLSDAVERTQFVWLSSLDQSNAVLTMSGTATSLNAVADFYTNLESTGYFKNIDVANAQDSSGNFIFSLRCEFAPPRNQAGSAQSASAGGD